MSTPSSPRTRPTATSPRWRARRIAGALVAGILLAGALPVGAGSADSSPPSPGPGEPEVVAAPPTGSQEQSGGQPDRRERRQPSQDAPDEVTQDPVGALDVTAQDAPHIEISVTPTGFADTDGNGRYEQHYATNDGATDCPGSWTLQMSVSGAPLHQGRIEMRLTSARWHPGVIGLVGGFPIAGTSVLFGSYDIYAPYDEHVFAINLVSPLNADGSGINFTRTFRTCPTTFINPYDATGTISFRVTGTDADGNPVEVPAGSYEFEFRPPRSLVAQPFARAIVPAEDPGPGTDPGYNLTFDFKVAAACFGGIVCAPYVGTITQSFAGLPPGAKLVSVDWVTPPPDSTWDPPPPSGDITTLHLPGVDPLDLSALTGLAVADPVPSSVALPLRTWARRVCPENPGVPGHLTQAPANAGAWPTPGGIFCPEPRDYDRLRWAVTVWVPEPPVTTSYSVTLTNAGDFDWDGVNERTWFDNPNGGTLAAVTQTYTLNPRPPISLHAKEGCQVTGLSHAHRVRAHGSHMTSCELLPDHMPGAEYTWRVTFRPQDAIVVDPVVVDVLPPGAWLESFTVPSPPAGGAPGDNTWSTEFHAGPCDRDTTTGWVAQASWTDPLSAVRCIRWRAPFTSFGGQNHDFVIHARRDPALNPFALPAAGHPYQSPHGPLVAEWNTSGAECYRNATPPPSNTGWVAAGSVPVDDVRCVRWRRPTPSGGLDTVVVFTVDAAADPDGDTFDPGEGIWWSNVAAMWSENAPNATAESPLLANAWSGSVNQTIATTRISYPAGNFSGHLPAPGGSMIVTADSRLLGAYNHGGGMRNWAIRLRIPDYLVWDPSYGDGDGVADGVQVHVSPTQFADRTGATLPYTCTFIPDATPHIPGGGDVECQADGDTADVVGVDTGAYARRGWEITLRLYRAPGMPAGTRSITSFAYQSLPEAPFTPQTVHPTYGPIAPDGIPYARRNVEHVPASWASDTTVGAPTFTPTFVVSKDLEDPGDDPAAAGQLVEYLVGIAHASVNNPDLTSAYVYDFPGHSPVDGAPLGDFRPRFVSVAPVPASEPITFEYTCDTAGDTTPTAGEAGSYTWVASPTTAPCSTPADVVGIRARLDHGGTGRFPVYAFATWNIGDPIDASTLRSTRFRVTVQVPETAEHGQRFVNRAHLRAAEIGLTTFSNERSAVVGPLAARVRVTKATDPAGYGQDFTVRLSGPGGYLAAAPVNAGTGTSAAFTDMEIDGTYALEEIDLPAGWSLDAITCEDAEGEQVDPDALVLTRGSDVTCTVRNVAEPARLTVRKATEPGRFDQDFTVRLTGPGDATSTGTINAGTGTTAAFTGLVPGATYTLAEVDLPRGWSQASASCEDASGAAVSLPTFVPAPNQEITCTFVNVDDPASITVRKTTAYGDYDADFTVVVHGSDDSVAKGTVNDAHDRMLVMPVVPGVTYQVTEADPGPGWRVESIACTDLHGTEHDPDALTLAPGDHVTCEIVNEPIPDLVLTKTVDVVAGPVDHVFTYTLTWHNRGHGPAFDAVITDTLPAGLTFVDSPDCQAHGQVVTCELAWIVEPGASGSVRLRARAGVAGPLTNHAIITSAGGDPDLTNNESSTDVVTAVVTPPTLPRTGRGIQAAGLGAALVALGVLLRVGRRRPALR